MIRQMTIEDLPSVKSLMQSVPHFWHDCWTEQTLHRALSASSDLAVVYELDGQLVGSLFCYDLGFRAYLGEFAVSEEKRGQGIGKQMLGHVEGILRERGCELVISDVWKSAEAYYRKEGWKEPQAVLLVKRLEQ